MIIGDVAKKCGVPAKTIRYYEEIGLIAPAQRAANGYRTYDDRSVEVLRFIKRSRDLGFSIEEVTDLLALWRDDHRSSSEVRAVAVEHLARIERKIKTLQTLRDSVVHLVGACHGDARPDCPILDDLASGGPDD